MDPLECLLLPWDTSLCLVREFNRLGHETYLFTPSSVFSIAGEVYGRGALLTPKGRDRYLKGLQKKWNLADFEVVWIRKDPPFDATYLSLTYLLEPLAKKTVVINHPQGIRNANEKIFGLRWLKESPLTLISSHVDEIFLFKKKTQSDLVIKPFYEKGGKGVFLLQGKNRKKGAWALLRKATQEEKEPVIAQKFIPVPRGKGDKRILLWKGKILGAFERIPPAGDFRSNLSLGGRFDSCSITLQEKKIVKKLAPALIEEGLFFVGIDVRMGFLIEINVTSPAGLVELDQLYGGVTAKLARVCIPNAQGRLP